MLVTHPRLIEQKVHAALKDVREGNEWFRCDVSHAVSKIRELVGSGAILERVCGSLEQEETAPIAPEPKWAEQSAKPPPAGTKEFRRTATYTAPCTHCGDRFTVTLTGYDAGARCPNCFRVNDTSEFERHEFVI